MEHKLKISEPALYRVDEIERFQDFTYLGVANDRGHHFSILLYTSHFIFAPLLRSILDRVRVQILLIGSK